jgi:hypothetical protein
MKLLLCVLASAAVQPAFACDLCAIYAANQARAEIGRGPFFGVAEQYTRFATVQVDGHRIFDASHQYMDSAVSQVYAGYNINQRLGLQFTAPLIYRSYKRPDSAGGIERGTESGLGDVALLANVLAYHLNRMERTLNVSLIGGVKFPTGNSDRIKEEFTEVENPVGPPSGIHGHDLTLGSGSYDGLIGVSVFGRWQKAFVAANVQYSIRSKGDFDYRFANDLVWTFGPGFYLALEDNYSVTFQLVASGEYKGKDTFQGTTAGDTGMTAVYLGPEVGFTWHEHLSAHFGADLPVTLQNTSLQTVPDFRIRAGVTWHF